MNKRSNIVVWWISLLEGGREKNSQVHKPEYLRRSRSVCHKYPLFGDKYLSKAWNLLVPLNWARTCARVWGLGKSRQREKGAVQIKQGLEITQTSLAEGWKESRKESKEDGRGDIRKKWKEGCSIRGPKLRGLQKPPSVFSVTFTNTGTSQRRPRGCFSNFRTEFTYKFVATNCFVWNTRKKVSESYIAPGAISSQFSRWTFLSRIEWIDYLLLDGTDLLNAK